MNLYSYTLKFNIQDLITMIKNNNSAEEKITYIKQAMLRHLNNFQMEELHKALVAALADERQTVELESEEDFFAAYIGAKRVEGWCEKTLECYSATLDNGLSLIQ